MIPFAPIWLVIKNIGAALNGMLGIVPPLAWAGLLAVALMSSCASSHRADRATASLKTLKAEVFAQVDKATKLYAAKKAEAQALAEQLAAARAEQEKKDADNAKTVADLRRRAAGQRLRDPGWTGGGCTASRDPADVGPRKEHPAEAGGVLSEALTGLLLDDALAADEINIAYDSARSELMTLHATIKQLGSCLPAPGPPASGRPAGSQEMTGELSK